MVCIMKLHTNLHSNMVLIKSAREVIEQYNKDKFTFQYGSNQMYF